MEGNRALLAVGGVLAVCAAVLAAMGFRGRDIVAGLDLGTTYTTLAYRDSGALHVLRDAHNRTTTPSVVAVRGGRFLLGEDALDALTDDPFSVVFDSKRVIGRRWEDPLLQEENERHQGRIVPHPSARRDAFGKSLPWWKLLQCRDCVPEPAFVLRMDAASVANAAQLQKHKCVDAGSVLSRAELSAWLTSQRLHPAFLDTLDADAQLLLLTPTAVGCLIIRHMFDALSSAVQRSPVRSSVVTVPAEFTVAQRHATSDAYVRAGLAPSRVLHEPAAAAVAYGLHRDASVHHVIVFDMGGGTLDISVLFMQQGAFSLIGSDGDVHLGGEDFDDCMLRLILEQAAGQGVELQVPDAAEAQGGAVERRRDTPLRRKKLDLAHHAHGVCSIAWLKHEAERVKIALSGPPGTAAQWQCRTEKTAGSPARSIRASISRETFEQRCDALFQRSLVPVRNALEAANLAVDEVQEVVLVGGSSRLPRVRDMLSEMFHKPVRHTVDPDLAVATGAALIVD